MPLERPVGGTELSWCRAVPGGTGITVVAALLSRHPEQANIEATLRRIQSRHPPLLARLQWTDRNPVLSFSPDPYVSVEAVDSGETSRILESCDAGKNPLHALLERELNRNSWPATQIDTPAELFFATVYALPDSRAVLAFRMHTVVCDRASAAEILQDFLLIYGREPDGFLGEAEGRNGEIAVPLPVEDMVPKRKAKKPFWARGVDLVGYSLGSFRFSNLKLGDTVSSRASRVIRLQMDRDETSRLLEACKKRGMKLCVALAAAGLKAANLSKEKRRPPENYAVLTIVNCRSILDPPLQSHHAGFYHSAILNTQSVNEQEGFWETAKRYSDSLANSMKNNKHFNDMGELNFLMCKAIDFPSVTPCSSMRTSFISVFESPIMDDDDSESTNVEIGLEDYIACSSVHGVGPSIAVFDTIRGERLDCACVYPWPLHSGKQMEQLVLNMKSLLLANI